MAGRRLFGSLIKLAVLGACVYGIIEWRATQGGAGDAQAFARRACVDAIGARYNVSHIQAYEVRENSNGFVVRATATLANGSPAKVVCLANRQGGVRDVSILER